MVGMSGEEFRERLAAVYEARRAGIARFVEAVPAEMLGWEPRPVVMDEFGVVTVGVWGGYALQIAPMIGTDRVLMSPDDTGWDFGWCFPPGIAAVLALLTWYPGSEAEPVGFIKRAGYDGVAVRRAGQEARRSMYR